LTVEKTIRDPCTDPVFRRGQKYRNGGRIQRIDRLDDVVTAVVRGSSQYDVTVEWGRKAIDARCTCPYDGAGECKHVVAYSVPNYPSSREPTTGINVGFGS
jgi:uncharacterized Zn finger protein